MPGHRLDIYIRLELRLSILRTHYALCEELQVRDVLEWAGFFLKWSQEALETGSDWAKRNLLSVDRLVVEIAKSKSASSAAVILGVAMADAAKGLETEIMTFSMPVTKKRA